MEFLEERHILIFDLGDLPFDFADQIVKFNDFFFLSLLIFLVDAWVVKFRCLDSVDKLINFDDVENFTCDPSTVISVNVFLLFAIDDQKRTEFLIDFDVTSLSFGYQLDNFFVAVSLGQFIVGDYHSNQKLCDIHVKFCIRSFLYVLIQWVFCKNIFSSGFFLQGMFGFAIVWVLRGNERYLVIEEFPAILF